MIIIILMIISHHVKLFENECATEFSKFIYEIIIIIIIMIIIIKNLDSISFPD